jgi:hypothetical protein
LTEKKKKIEKHFLCFLGGLICFSIRVDVHDTPNYGYKDKIDQLVMSKKWDFVMKEATVYHTNVGKRVELEKCYVLIYKILMNE